MSVGRRTPLLVLGASEVCPQARKPRAERAKTSDGVLRERGAGVGFRMHHRSETLQRTAISLNEDFRLAWLVVFCKQSPWKVVTLEMRRVPRRVHVDAGVEEFQDRRMLYFEIFPLQHARAGNIPAAPDQDLWILPRTFFDGRLLCAAAKALPFDEFGRELVRPTRERQREAGPPRARTPRAPEGFRETLRSEFPWLSEADLDKALGIQHPGQPRDRRATDPPACSHPLYNQPSDTPQESCEDTCAEGVLEVYDPEDLAAMRETMVVEEHRAMQFYVRILGGRWTFQHTGAAADGCSYFARAGQAQVWCRKFGFPRQRGYHYLKYGGPEGPHLLCNEICRRAQHFFDLWMRSDDPVFRYSGVQRDAYTASEEFRAWRSLLVGGCPLQRAADQHHPVAG